MSSIHLLNTVDQVRGVSVFADDARGAGSGGEQTQSTPWISVAEFTAKHYYDRAHDSKSMKRVDITQICFPVGQRYRSVDIYRHKRFTDETSQLVAGE
ncbi:hypothetical protein N9B17_01365 [Rhodopirellula sp.]|nr:hypothetical protein [Rhodopirellula sp.]